MDDLHIDPRTERIAAVIDRWVYRGGFHGPQLAALRVLADDELRAGLAAADVLRSLDEQHQPRRWSEQSDVVVCTAGCGAFPCRTRDVLDGGFQP